MNIMTPSEVTQASLNLPFLVYAVRRDGRIVYIGRGSNRRACVSAREKGGTVEVIEAHASEAQMIAREKYWIECLKPEMNKRPGEDRHNGVSDCPFQLPYHIRNGNVGFYVQVPIEGAYSYHAIANVLRQHVGSSHAKARMLEDMIGEFVERLQKAVDEESERQ